MRRRGPCVLYTRRGSPSGCRKPRSSAGDGRAQAQAPAGTGVFCDVKWKPSKFRHVAPFAQRTGLNSCAVAIGLFVGSFPHPPVHCLVNLVSEAGLPFEKERTLRGPSPDTHDARVHVNFRERAMIDPGRLDVPFASTNPRGVSVGKVLINCLTPRED